MEEQKKNVASFMKYKFLILTQLISFQVILGSGLTASTILKQLILTQRIGTLLESPLVCSFLLTSIPKELHYRQLANLQIKNLSALCTLPTFLRVFSLSSKQASFWRLTLKINSSFGDSASSTHLPTHPQAHAHRTAHTHKSFKITQ